MRQGDPDERHSTDADGQGSYDERADGDPTIHDGPTEETAQPTLGPDELQPTPARGNWGLITDRTFGPYFAGRMLSTTGVWIHNVAAALVVWDLTRSTFLVGMVSVGQFLPQFLLAPWSGARADRGDRRRQLVTGRVISAAAAGLLTIWILTVGLVGLPGTFTVIAAATVFGIGFALGAPAQNSLIPSLVTPSELPSAIALNSMPMTVARATGPALGALLLYGVGPAAAFGTSASLNMTFALIIASLRIQNLPRPTSGDGSVREGWRYLRSQAGMSALMLGVIALSVGSDPVITLTPAIADRLGYPSSFVGTLASCFGSGAFLGFLSLSRVRLLIDLPRLGVIGLLVLAVSMTGLLLTPVATGAAIALIIGGVGMAFAMTSMTTMIQQQVQEAMRGRVMALWGVAFLGSRPVAAGVTGWVTDATTVTVALAGVVLVVLLGAIAIRPSHVRSDRVK